jgi:AcrR family transcriptional regulator
MVHSLDDPVDQQGQRLSRHQEAARSAILAGGRAAFAQKGKAATMADVAAAAGVSQGLAYRYFDSKEALFRELVEDAVQTGFAALAPIRDLQVSPGTRLALLFTKMIEMRHAHPEVFCLLDHVADLDDDANVGPVPARQRRDGFLRLLRDLVVAGQRAGEVADDDPDELVVAIAATLDGLTRFGVHEPDRYRASPPSADIFLRLLTPRPA